MYLHEYFVYILKAGGHRLTETVVEGPPQVWYIVCIQVCYTNTHVHAHRQWLFMNQLFNYPVKNCYLNLTNLLLLPSFEYFNVSALQLLLIILIYMYM